MHYAVEVPIGRAGVLMREAMGGYFETHWSVNPHWTADFKSLPKHPITRGVKPFTQKDEWYFHMRFQPEMKGVTPILSAHPPKETMNRKDGPPPPLDFDFENIERVDSSVSVSWQEISLRTGVKGRSTPHMMVGQRA